MTWRMLDRATTSRSVVECGSPLPPFVRRVTPAKDSHAVHPPTRARRQRAGALHDPAEARSGHDVAKRRGVR
jgi:hypothetical protein